MNRIMTVIANPAIRKLTTATVEAIQKTLAEHGVVLQGGEWLAPEEAYDLMIQGDYTEALHSKVMKSIEGEPYDVVVQQSVSRRKKMLIADMDSTMITIECIDELADYAGIKEHVARITERAMNGELDFKAALRERVALLKGLQESVLEQAYSERVKLMPGGKALLATMRKHGGKAVLVSGGFTYFTSRVAEAIGFNEQQANILEIEQGVLTGKVVEPILDKEAKLHNLHHYAKLWGIAVEDVIAVGDGANDLPMLKAAGTGVAYHAKPHVQQEVNTRINHADLTALLYIQGYRKSDIIAA